MHGHRAKKSPPLHNPSPTVVRYAQKTTLPLPDREKHMAKHVFVVFTNPVEGKDATYNDWYDNRHLPDVLDVPGFVSAQRFRLSDTQRAAGPFPWHYLALYEIETDDLKQTLAALGARSGTSAMVMSDALAEQRLAWVFDPVTPLVTKKS
jgi:hypothetical protein